MELEAAVGIGRGVVVGAGVAPQATASDARKTLRAKEPVRHNSNLRLMATANSLIVNCHIYNYAQQLQTTTPIIP
ncbi:MAG: hypothetical protein ACUVWR_08950 [Anaerolineae bacterium]